ncbi:MAG TPA: OpgC domain-containing protein [Bradyrhizobium sp.]|uniref:OpgC domain-containing protein n=1 Tax=Bradyrhizobium sp. TaxID=376 RepID=UPI002CE12E64|nr:OpgC domain-containing protein [Bradyrhizobium sp.]HLZ05448.1 OpgC domain-containing protein [Bradyrhizobium sp.]
MNASVKKNLATQGSDKRIDLLRGFANWFLLLDHIPHNVVNLLTLRNFGFSGATDVFVFVAGYGATVFFGQMALDRGFLVTTTRIFRRAWQLYAAYVVLFVIYIDIISNVATRYATTDIFDEYNVTGIVDHPIRTLMHGLLLQAKPLNLDTLQLFVALMLVFPLLLWSMLRRPNLTLAGSIALYVAARAFDWSLPAFPSGSWYFNPFCWQLLAVLGGWFAVDGAKLTAAAHRLSWLRIAAASYLLLALAITVGLQVPALAGLAQHPGLDLLTAGDKENLAFYRVVHLLALALLFTYFVPRDWPALQSRWLEPVMKCGEEWLASFCVGVFLSFAGHFVLITQPNSIAIQMLVSASGIAIMTAIAYYISWSRRQDDKSVSARRRAEKSHDAGLAGTLPPQLPAE